MKNVEKIINIISIIFLCAFLFIFWHPLTSNFFHHTDFYINYSNGFIRRGLDGEIIYIISDSIETYPWKIQKLYSFICLLGFFLLLLYCTIKYKIPLYIIFSGSFLFLFIYGNSGHLKKDHIIALLFLINILTIKNSKRLNIKLILFQNIILILGTCIHELYYFFSICPILFAYKFYFPKEITFKKKLELILIPTIIFILLCTIFKGNIEAPLVMSNSWENLGLHNLTYGKGIFDGSLFIWKSDFSLSEYIFISLILICHFIFNYISIYTHGSKTEAIYFNYLLITQTLVCILIMILAIDFSRWIFFTTFTTMLCFFVFKKNKEYSFNRNYPIIFVSQFLLTMPFTRDNMFSAYFDLMPINIFLKSIKSIFLL